jgi:hypothetical protein
MFLALTFTLTCFLPCSRGEVPNFKTLVSPISKGTEAESITAPKTIPTARQQTSKQLLSNDPRGQYLVIKRTLAGLVSNPAGASAGEPYDLEDCKSGSDYLGVSEDSAALALANLAYIVVHLRKTLPRLGFPESAWDSMLSQFENEQLNLRLREIGRPFNPESASARHYDAFKEKLVRQLNGYRAQGATSLPKVLYEGGCGAGEVNVTIRTEPGNGQAILIPVFFFELCKAQQYDPDNRSLCTWWVDPPEGAPLAVSGDYFFRASWPDGVEKRGRASFDAAKDGQTFIIRKP